MRLIFFTGEPIAAIRSAFNYSRGTAMAHILCTVLFCAVSAAAVPAQVPLAHRPAAEAARRTLLEHEDAWATALIARDGATFRQLLAPGFIYTEDDRLMSRTDVLNDVVSGPDTVTAARNDGMEVHLFPPAGVVTGWLIVRGHGKGGPFEHRYRFTDTWLERNGRWQIVAAQDYLKPRE
ncbi:MAG TPA: nuclear transport factor 2 family protein [Gemmatimonadaceae bacterium]